MIVANKIKSLISEDLNIDQNEIKTLIPKFDKYGYVSINYYTLKELTGFDEQKIKSKLEKILKIDYIDRIEFINDYCNIFVNPNKYIDYFKEVYNEDYIANSINIGNGKKVLLEHTSTTPDASPHLGRSRGTIIGDFIKKILLQTNYDVKTEFFVNDLAKQVSMIVDVYDFDKWYNLKEISELYIKSYNECKNDEEKEKKIDFQIKECQNGNPEYQNKFAIVTNNCISEQDNIFKDFQVSFDEYVFESGVLNIKSNQLLTMLNDRKIISGDINGCIYIPVKKDGELIKDIFLTRDNGSSLYMIRDLCYFLTKYDGNYDKSIVVMPSYQNDHMSDINYILTELNLPLSTIVYYENVYKDGKKMSTKNSSGVLLEDLIFDLRKYVLKIDNSLSDDIVKLITNKAIRKYVLNVKPDKKLNYSYSNIKKICCLELKKELFLEQLKNDNVEEKARDNIDFQLIKKLDMIDDIIKSSAKSLNAQSLIKYEDDLFKLFYDSYIHDKVDYNLIEKYILAMRTIEKSIMGNEIERSNKHESSNVRTYKIK